VSDEPVRGRLQSDGRKAAVQVGFMYGDGGASGGNGIGVQPGQGQLVRGRKQHDRVGRAAPALDQVGMGRCDVKRGVRKLGGLVTRVKIGTRDEVQAR
jgi:hypothetical protein